MVKSWQEIQTIREFIELCKEEANKYNVDLNKKEKEDLAAAILTLTFSDYFNE